MALDWGEYDQLPAVTPIRRKKTPGYVARKSQERWVMSLEELCCVAGIDAAQFTLWAEQGIIGKRLDGRRVTRELAQRTIPISRLVAAGVHPLAAGCVAQGHKVNDTTPLHAVLPGGVEITIRRSDLP